MIVSNSTPLIYLAKIGKLFLLRDFFKEVLIPEEVQKEVIDRGKEENCPDAFIVEKALREGWIKVEKVSVIKELQEFGIDLGEAEAISLALKSKSEILVDQTHARIAAKALGLKPRGTIHVLLRALKKGKLTYDEYLSSLEDMVKSGFRLSSEIYLEAVRLGREFHRS